MESSAGKRMESRKRSMEYWRTISTDDQPGSNLGPWPPSLEAETGAGVGAEAEAGVGAVAEAAQGASTPRSLPRFPRR